MQLAPALTYDCSKCYWNIPIKDEVKGVVFQPRDPGKEGADCLRCPKGDPGYVPEPLSLRAWLLYTTYFEYQVSLVGVVPTFDWMALAQRVDFLTFQAMRIVHDEVSEWFAAKLASGLKPRVPRKPRGA